MRKPSTLIFLLLSAMSVARAQTPTPLPSPSSTLSPSPTPSLSPPPPPQQSLTPDSMPIEINATGQTNYEGGIATANDNVAIHIGDTDIYADHARYDSHTHDVEVDGNVRIYRGIHLYVGNHAIYNTDTKQIHATHMRGEYEPYFVSGEEINVVSDNETIVKKGNFTTDDSDDPSFHLRASTVRIYENDRAIFQNVTLYVGKVPIFWWPYLYQSLNDSFSFSISPAYLSSWGPSLLTQVTFPITKDIIGR